MRLLLVEDEKRMAQALCEILRLEKYDMDHCADGLDGMYVIESGIYDLVILDVMLPRKNGFEIVKEVREKGIRTPILMLTAKSEDMDKILGLEYGADDYITKPFNILEVKARIKPAAAPGAPGVQQKRIPPVPSAAQRILTRLSGSRKKTTQPIRTKIG